MKTTRTLSTIAAGALLTALTACGSGSGSSSSGSDSGTSTPTSATASTAATSPGSAGTGATSPATQRATASTHPGSPSSSTPARTAEGGGATRSSTPATSCASTTKSAAAAEAIRRIPTAFDDPGFAWVVSDEDNHYDRCAELSYIVLGIRGTASSPYQVALFHHGTFLGTATKEAYGFYPVVTRLSDRAIQVRYTYTRGTECTACATGRSIARFTWNNASQSVTMTGSVPPRENN